MKILIDADACPVRKKAESVAKEFDVPCVLIHDVSHEYKSDYSQIRRVEKGKDSTDLAIFNLCEEGDIVITQDGGLASMVLAKKAYAINASGMRYTNQNIDEMLIRRHLARKERRRKGRSNISCSEKGTRRHGSFNYEFPKLVKAAKGKERQYTNH